MRAPRTIANHGESAFECMLTSLEIGRPRASRKDYNSTGFNLGDFEEFNVCPGNGAD